VEFRALWLHKNTRNQTARLQALIVPAWIPVLAFALFPIARFSMTRRRRERWRILRGLCPRSGYDLRSTPNRCPECGTTPKKNPASTGTAIPRLI
jgi:hypothetical protein